MRIVFMVWLFQYQHRTDCAEPRSYTAALSSELYTPCRELRTGPVPAELWII